MKVKVIEDFNLEAFPTIEKTIVRANKEKDEKGKLYVGDTFECDETMYEYLKGKNPLKKAVVELEKILKAEEIQFPEIEEYKEVKKTKATKKKKTSKK